MVILQKPVILNKNLSPIIDFHYLHSSGYDSLRKLHDKWQQLFFVKSLTTLQKVYWFYQWQKLVSFLPRQKSEAYWTWSVAPKPYQSSCLSGSVGSQERFRAQGDLLVLLPTTQMIKAEWYLGLLQIERTTKPSLEASFSAWSLSINLELFMLQF